MAQKLMIEVDEKLLALLESWQEAGKAHSLDLVCPDYDKVRSDELYLRQREALLRFAIGTERRIQEVLRRAEVQRA